MTKTIKIKIGSGKITKTEDIDSGNGNDSEWTYNPKHDPKNKDPDNMARARLKKSEANQTFINFILEHGYVPVVKTEPILYGKGAQGTVYEVTKNGKRYALKVAYKDNLGAEQEIKIRKKIEEIRPQLPPEVSKHVVRCFDLFSDHELNGIVLEVMRPMTDLEEEILFKGISYIDRNKSVPPEEKFLRHQHRYVTTPGRPAKGWDPNKDPKVYDPNRTWPNWDDEKFKVDYPGKPFQSDKPKQTFEKQKSFSDAMNYLADNFKIFWSDLHQLNIMIRPSTRDYVATDIGLFNIGSY